MRSKTRSAHRSPSTEYQRVEARPATRSHRVVDGSADGQRAEPAGAERAQLSGRDSRAAVSSIPTATAASNYGAIGAIIGHEISHSFDDTGSQFDATGRFVNWWTPEDLAHFKAAARQAGRAVRRLHAVSRSARQRAS